MDAATLAVALAAGAAALLVARFLFQTVLRGSRPPVYEPVPLIGGLLAFAGVRGGGGVAGGSARRGARFGPACAGPNAGHG